MGLMSQFKATKNLALIGGKGRCHFLAVPCPRLCPGSLVRMKEASMFSLFSVQDLSTWPLLVAEVWRVW